MTVNLVRINVIDPNPWQPRMSEDADHIANLAVSIAEDGMMQIPSARQVGERVQLAFGHSRHAAYKLLDQLQERLGRQDRIDFEEESALARAVVAADRAIDNGVDFLTMPLNLVDLDDEQMYRYAVSENIQRKDLSPIEAAKSMRRYRDEFGKKSADIGDLFGVNESTVRGMLRLLDLPEPLQAKLSSGEMTVGAARKVLAMKQAVKPEDFETLTTDRFSKGRTVDEIIQSKIEASNQSLVGMHRRYSSESPRGGDGLWLLNWTYTTPPYSMPEAETIMKLWRGPDVIAGRKVKSFISDCIMALCAIQPGLERTFDQLYAEHGHQWRGPLDLLKQLSSPPPCTTCEYYIRQDGDHFCALKACWENKFARFAELELTKLKKKMNIPGYIASQDGRETIKLEGYVKEHGQWVEEKHPDLRLIIKKNPYGKHAYTESNCVGLVMTGAEAQRIKRTEKAEQEKNGNKEQQWQRINRKRSLYWDSVRKFIKEQGAPVFGVALEKLAGGVLDDLVAYVGNGGFNRPGAAIAYQLLYRRYDVSKSEQVNDPTPIRTAALWMRGVASTWSVKLPPDWLEIAAGYEPDLSEFPECVSTETAVAEVQ
jgi:ParB-like chromosome segregation protein Spo0J